MRQSLYFLRRKVLVFGNICTDHDIYGGLHSHLENFSSSQNLKFGKGSIKYNYTFENYQRREERQVQAHRQTKVVISRNGKNVVSKFVFNHF